MTSHVSLRFQSCLDLISEGVLYVAQLTHGEATDRIAPRSFLSGRGHLIPPTCLAATNGYFFAFSPPSCDVHAPRVHAADLVLARFFFSPPSRGRAPCSGSREKSSGFTIVFTLIKPITPR